MAGARDLGQSKEAIFLVALRGWQFATLGSTITPPMNHSQHSKLLRFGTKNLLTPRLHTGMSDFESIASWAVSTIDRVHIWLVHMCLSDVTYTARAVISG